MYGSDQPAIAAEQQKQLNSITAYNKKLKRQIADKKKLTGAYKEIHEEARDDERVLDDKIS